MSSGDQTQVSFTKWIVSPAIIGTFYWTSLLHGFFLYHWSQQLIHIPTSYHGSWGLRNSSKLLRQLGQGRVNVCYQDLLDPRVRTARPCLVVHGRCSRLGQYQKRMWASPTAGKLCSARLQWPLMTTHPLLQYRDQDKNVNHLQLGGCGWNIPLLRKTGKFSACLALSVNPQDLSGALN